MSRPQTKASLYRDAVKSSRFTGLYVVAPLNPLPPKYPDNRPLSPVKFGVSAEPIAMGQQAQQWNWEEVGLVCSWWTLTREHAERLRDKVESILAEGDGHIRGAWYDLDMGEMVDAVHFAASVLGIELFTEAERQAKLQRIIERTIRRAA